MSRITGRMSLVEIIGVMAESSEEAADACVLLVRKGDAVDTAPWCGGGLASVLELDALGIYGPRISALFNEVCGRHVGKMVALLRATQLGGLAGVNARSLNHAIDNHGEGIDVVGAVKAVQGRLPKFNFEAGA